MLTKTSALLDDSCVFPVPAGAACGPERPSAPERPCAAEVPPPSPFVPAGNLLNPAQAAALLGLANPRTLAAWRLRRQGPPYVRVGAVIRYDRGDLARWLACRRVVVGRPAAGEEV
jgi:hypothetical protein